MNVVLVAPAGIVTAGTVAAPLLLVTVSGIPLAGAAAEITTVAVTSLPPVTEVGLSVTDKTVGGITTATTLPFSPFADAITPTFVVWTTDPNVTENVCDV